MSGVDANIAPRGNSVGLAATRIPLRGATMWWLVLSVMTITLFALAEMSVAVVAAYLLFGVGGLLWAHSVDRVSARIFLVVFGAAAVAAVLLHAHYTGLYGVPYWHGGSDELHYEERGKAFAESLGIFDYGGIRGSLVSEWHNSVGYIYLVGILTKFGQTFGGEHTLVPRLFNAVCLGLIAVGVYRLGHRLELRQRTAIVAGMFAGCLPLMMWVTVQTLRDIVISALLVGLVLVWTPERDAPRRRSILLAIVWTLLIVLALLELRRGQAFIAVLIAGSGFLAFYHDRGRIVWFAWLGVASAGAAWLYLMLSEVISGDVGTFLLAVDRYARLRVEVTGGGLSTVVFTTPPPFGYVLRIGYALILPLPVPSPNLYELWINAGTVIHILFIPFLLAGLRLASRQRAWWPVLGAFLMLFVGMAMFTFTVRHIVQYLPFAILLAALGYERYHAQRYVVFAATGGLGAVLAATYFTLKM